MAPITARFVFASNAPGPMYGLAPDLLARLMVLDVPPLGERIADIPTLFNHVLEASLGRHGIPVTEVMAALKGDHYESLCLDGFHESNVRGLIDLADRIAARVASKTTAERAVSTIFAKRFEDSPVVLRHCGGSASAAAPGGVGRLEKADSASNYERYRDIIIRAHRDCQGNVSAMERLLRGQGLRCSRRWLAIYLEKWGIRSE